MIGGRLGFRKKPHQQSAWLQLLLAVGLFRWRLPDSSPTSWSTSLGGLHHSHSLRGGMGALQLTGARLIPSLHSKTGLFLADEYDNLLDGDDFERLSYLYRRAHSHLITYLAEDLQDRPVAAAAAGPTAIDEPQQSDSLTREVSTFHEAEIFILIDLSESTRPIALNRCCSITFLAEIRNGEEI